MGLRSYIDRSPLVALVSASAAVAVATAGVVIYFADQRSDLALLRADQRLREAVTPLEEEIVDLTRALSSVFGSYRWQQPVGSLLAQWSIRFATHTQRRHLVCRSPETDSRSTSIRRNTPQLRPERILVRSRRGIPRTYVNYG